MSKEEIQSRIADIKYELGEAKQWREVEIVERKLEKLIEDIERDL